MVLKRILDLPQTKRLEPGSHLAALRVFFPSFLPSFLLSSFSFFFFLLFLNLACTYKGALGHCAHIKHAAHRYQSACHALTAYSCLMKPHVGSTTTAATRCCHCHRGPCCWQPRPRWAPRCATSTSPAPAPGAQPPPSATPWAKQHAQGLAANLASHVVSCHGSSCQHECWPDNRQPT